MTVYRHARPLATLALLPLAGFLVCSCGWQSGELQAGSYRAVLDLPDGQLPFGLDVEVGGDRSVLFLVNGDERLRIDDVTVVEGQLRAILSDAGSTLTARISGGKLEGEVRLTHPDARPDSVLFRATLGQDWRFFENPSSDNADIDGRWAVTLVGEKGRQIASTVEFRQSFERVTGSFSGRPDAPGLLAGEMRGDELYLSRFDGQTALLLRARVGADGAMVGEYWSVSSGHRRFRAVRDTNGAAPPAPGTGSTGD